MSVQWLEVKVCSCSFQRKIILIVSNILLYSFSYFALNNDISFFLQGGVGLRIRVYDRRICFVNNHFAAHLENVSRRNADFDHIYRTMTFNKPHGSAGTSFSTFIL